MFSSVQDFGINRTLSDRLEGMSAELLTPVASATKAEVQKSHILTTCMKSAAVYMYVCESERRGGLMISALDSGERAVWVWALAGDIVLCSWGKTLYCHSAYLHPGV